MTALNARTPVVIGVGEASETITGADYAAMSPADLAAAAAHAALDDAGVTAAAAGIDVLAAIRQFEISTPGAAAPFGCSNNFPRSVARRIGAAPARAILEITGGQGPQHLVNEFAHEIAAGRAEMALFVGSEAISTVRHLQGKGETRDWAETVEGPLEDRGYGLEGLLSPQLMRHGARAPMHFYALFENARRARLGLDRAAYRQEMGKLFAPFTDVAAGNPHAMSRQRFTAAELAAITPDNRLVADPFPRRVVSRDQANQGAAVLVTSLGKAQALGVAPEKMIFLRGGADVYERTVMEREDLAASRASVRAVEAALKAAGVSLSDIGVFDLYSCFPIAVFNILDAFGLAADDPRGLTVTGGLPFFGGAGNNYSMHAIASMVRSLRAKPDALGLVAANGGFLSKYSVGVYSAAPAPFAPFDSKPLQAEIDAWPAPPLTDAPEGDCTIETYTIDYTGAAPRVTIVGRDAAGGRFAAQSAKGDADIPAAFERDEPLGAGVDVTADASGQIVVKALRPR
ncbi:MAG: acetyl-CoA acetyltransferase [Alphaproteobacteria bacterium]|nr:acetyl-CoA acetyltransferase [Alphaproteobacteria bacterium]